MRGCKGYVGVRFCDDFDDALALAPRWKLQSSLPGADPGAHIFVQAGGYSAPNMVGALIPLEAGVASTLFSARAYAPVTASSRVRVHARIRVPSFAGAYMDILDLETQSVSEFVLSLYMNANRGLFLKAVDGVGPAHLDQAVTSTADFLDWTDVELTLAIDPLTSKATTSLMIEGKVAALDLPIMRSAPILPLDGGSIDVGVGVNVIETMSATKPTRVEVDDVAVWVDEP